MDSTQRKYSGGGRLWRVYFYLAWVSCASAQLSYSVSEELNPGSVVGNIAKDLTLTAQRIVQRRLRVVSESAVQYFEVKQTTGDLIIKQKIDRESLCDLNSQKPPNNDWRFTQGQRPGPSGYLHVFFPHFCHRATGGPEVAMGTGPWPQPPTEAEQLQALMAAANVSEATATLGPQFTLQHVPDYRQNVYIPGSTATLTSNPQQQQATAQQATQQALPPPQASAQPEPPKAAQTPASKKKSTKKEKK
uniref:Protocadherin 1 gamma 32 n=1 Tax=Amphilophus citrinellus TaxID=61819 RepID=A0A3Q0RDA4_AMPCI